MQQWLDPQWKQSIIFVFLFNSIQCSKHVRSDCPLGVRPIIIQSPIGLIKNRELFRDVAFPLVLNEIFLRISSQRIVCTASFDESAVANL